MMRSTLLITGFMVWAASPAQGQFKKIKGAIGKAVPQANLEPFTNCFKQY